MSSMIDSPHLASPGSAGVCRHLHDRGRCRRRTPVADSSADLELDELQDLLVVTMSHLLSATTMRGDADLTGEQHVLTRLRHRAVGRRDDQDPRVHLAQHR
jgi:hypothetical protein